MNKAEFKNLINLFDETYPKQPKLTVAQRLMFWVSLQQYHIDAVMGAFISHTNDKRIGEWKPQVAINLTRYLQQSDVQIKKLYQSFFDHKEVKDPLAVKIWNQMGGDSRMLKMTMQESDKKEVMFVDLYKQERVGENYNVLPNELKTKLIGALKND